MVKQIAVKPLDLIIMTAFQDMLGFLKKFYSGEFSPLIYASGITVNGLGVMVYVFVSLGKESISSSLKCYCLDKMCGW